MTRDVLWVNGRLIDPDSPALSAYDRGVTVGDGVFETFTTWDGRPFALSRHLARMEQSLADMRIGLSDALRQSVLTGIAAVVDQLRLQQQPHARVRVTVTAGPGPLGPSRPGALQHTVAVAAAGLPSPAGQGSPASHSGGTGGIGGSGGRCHVVRSPFKRNAYSAIAGVKSTSYAENVVALAHAREQGGDEALLANTDNMLCEGTSSNVFVELDGSLLTPPLSSGCLAGVTRELVVLWGAQAGLDVREAGPEDLPYTVLDQVAQGQAHLAITSAGRGVMPVTALDGVPLAPGPLSLRMGEVFASQKAQGLELASQLVWD